MARATTVTVNLDNVLHNYRLAKSMAPEQKAVAVVKANAYGHGAVAVAKKLAPEADAFAVACIEEAVELREAGIEGQPILLLEGFFTADELDYISANNLWTGVHNQRQLNDIKNAQLSQPITVLLKMDSGMHRLGFAPEEYAAVYHELKALPQVKDVILMSHFTSADDMSSPMTQKQIEVFDAATRELDADVSIANSAATLMHADARRNWQRPGIMLYGSSPFTDNPEIDRQLKPAMTLTSEVIAIHDLEPGEAIGYSGTWVCEKPTRVGTIAVGYADGYPRQAVNGTPVIVNGQRTKIIGRVSMDMLTVDLTDIDANLGSTVELWGENLLANEVAPCCGTISYTLFSCITARVHRKYIG
ncbi:MAG: alanine racemase [Oceanospirillaceae bacterium]|uniref:alanine racemase n=1 Tax=unclassified Thalassolituus TaxID=2624967 RepID=UPI000C5CBE7B|nr:MULTISPECIES: alanine racemase [unclassified Thalassolituus]MAS25546.1 alanine racemase [Oceanospirillaceae bacterium]MAX99134.1 alanine racemase [Oceanospirillaceae bacterium]MBL36208.1 alanine racemase [Oceanospirillaceae bacterium]MBS55108.1 alanine racemase [Oceanospirillaceae bacterium]|tara:strand:+ start:8341 stop:9420 length:1080 start_codon:yes stop_codon:yes gene_type:complete